MAELLATFEIIENGEIVGRGEVTMPFKRKLYFPTADIQAQIVAEGFKWGFSAAEKYQEEQRVKLS